MSLVDRGRGKPPRYEHRAVSNYGYVSMFDSIINVRKSTIYRKETKDVCQN